MSEAEFFDWGDLGEDFWREASTRVRKPGLKRPTEEQIKFACALHRGLSKSAAAEAAGYVGSHDEMRNRGHAAAKSTGVIALLEEAAIEAPADEGVITRDGRKRILSKIVRSGCHSDRIRANDSMEKIEQVEQAERATDKSSGDPKDTLSEIAGISPEFAAILATVTGLPADDFKITDGMKSRIEEARKTVTMNWIRQFPDQALEFAHMYMHSNGNGHDYQEEGHDAA